MQQFFCLRKMSLTGVDIAADNRGENKTKRYAVEEKK